MSIYVCIFNNAFDPNIQGVADSLLKVKEIIEREKPEGNDFIVEEWELNGSFIRYFRAMDEIESELHVDGIADAITSQLSARGIDPSTLVVTGREMKFDSEGPVIVECAVGALPLRSITLQGHVQLKDGPSVEAGEKCECGHAIDWHVGPNGVGLGSGPACHCGCMSFKKSEKKDG